MDKIETKPATANVKADLLAKLTELVGAGMTKIATIDYAKQKGPTAKPYGLSLANGGELVAYVLSPCVKAMGGLPTGTDESEFVRLFRRSFWTICKAQGFPLNGETNDKSGKRVIAANWLSLRSISADKLGVSFAPAIITAYDAALKGSVPVVASALPTFA